MPPSQNRSDSQLAAIQLRASAFDDGPDRFWPELVSQLRPFAVLTDNGASRSFRFENPDGGSNMNVMAQSDICPGAIFYQGTKNGLNRAACTALFLSNAGHYSASILSTSKIDVLSSHPKAELRLRVAEIEEYAAAPTEQKEDTPCSHESPDQLSVFILPWREENKYLGLGCNVVKKAIVLEEVNDGTKTWGRQIGHMKAAQMNGVGQHVFFGGLEMPLSSMFDACRF
ncbi:hypothetical protein FGADI_12253 [Fusarium gaditjirri]|uniref:Uncharacterized protein n=1 Tax=Fusarium gaditjirri TaxID=282569 RepID=A0A8H4SSG9_9HYPO|nr:hypothetical protein FGADI_12253 [Fusarium gaditjirri]